MTYQHFQTEATDQGEQALVPGVRPTTQRDRLALLMDKPLDVGLFNDDARRQSELF